MKVTISHLIYKNLRILVTPSSQNLFSLIFAGERMVKMPKNITSKTEIIEEALHLFTIYGYSFVSIKEISSQIGISKATLYHYFVSKEKLLHDCFDFYYDRLIESMKESKGNARECLYDFYVGATEKGCFVFNMMACDESACILHTKLHHFISKLKKGLSLSPDSIKLLMGSMLACKYYKDRASFDSFINTLKE